MAVISSNLFYSTASLGIQRNNTSVSKYRVHTDSKMQPLEVIAGSHTAGPNGVPYLYGYLQEGIYVVSTTAEQQVENNWTKWTVTVNGGKLPAGTNPANGRPGIDDNPLLYVTEMWVETQVETLVVEKDKIDDKAITNSAGEQFDIPPTRDVNRHVLVIVKNYASWEDISWLNEFYAETNNDAEVTVPISGGETKSFERLSLKYLETTCSPPNFELAEVDEIVADQAARLALTGKPVGYLVRQEDNAQNDYRLNLFGGEAVDGNWDKIVPDQPYYRGETRLLIDEEPEILNGAVQNQFHRLIVLDAGFNYLDTTPDPPVYRKILDENGVPVSQPGMLDGFGGRVQMIAGEPNVQWRTFTILEAKDYTPLFADPDYTTTPPAHLPPP